MQDKPWTEQYLWALFKALSHMLCIGYGRHPPQNIPETCVTITSMMTGATFYALFIAYSINVIQTMDSPGRSYKGKVISQTAVSLLSWKSGLNRGVLPMVDHRRRLRPREVFFLGKG